MNHVKKFDQLKYQIKENADEEWPDSDRDRGDYPDEESYELGKHQEKTDAKISKKLSERNKKQPKQEKPVVKESNEPGVDVFGLKGIDKKLNNLLDFDDFDKTFKPKEQKSTKRTDVGLDIVNEKNK